MTRFEHDPAVVEHVARALLLTPHVHTFRDLARAALDALATAPGWEKQFGMAEGGFVIEYSTRLDGALPQHRVRIVGPWQEVQE